ncbi:MAG: hypothetical protein EA370_09355 [Wenzhouxiangella sp.]|nr:MAG: hypothetical protein EA370_09355 [Wenzhouxiangella sp.]
MPIRLPLPALLLLLALLPMTAAAGDEPDPTAFTRLDPAQLRAAEQAMDTLVEAHTGKVLRTPVNAAEAYVIERQQRLVARLSGRPQVHAVDDGGMAKHFLPAARATRVQIGPDGQLHAQCISAASLLQPDRPDFRFSNRPSQPQR